MGKIPNFWRETYLVDLQDIGPASQESSVVMHGIAKSLPIVLWLVVKHLSNILIGFASHSNGIVQIYHFCREKKENLRNFSFFYAEISILTCVSVLSEGRS